MATGAGLGNLLTALMPVVGVITILTARRRRKGHKAAPADETLERRQAAARESERRMAAYLAQRHAGSYEADQSQDEKETMR